MSQIQGVEVSIFQDNEPLSIEDDGYLGRLGSSEPLLLQIEVGPGYSVYGFTVDGQKNVVPKRNLAEEPDNGKRYQLKIPVQQGEQGSYYTTYPVNNLRLVQHLDDDPRAHFAVTGTVQVWEIAVISQGGEFFLTVQPTYQAEAYEQGWRKNAYPRFEEWPQMNDYLVSLLPKEVMPLNIRLYAPDEEPLQNGLASNEGTVSWFNCAQGLGALKHAHGTARVHWSQIEKRPRRAYLEAGEKVRFQQLRQPHTKVRTTSFSEEAVGVTLVS